MAIHHVRPGEKIHLPSVASNPDARTSALVKTDGFEAVQLVVRAGDRIAAHSVEGYATLHCIEGAVILEASDRLSISAGDWLYLDRGQSHSLSAVEDSSLLLTILFD